MKDFVGVHFYKADGEVVTGGEGAVQDDTAGRRLHAGCLEDGDGLCTKGCRHG